MCICQFKNFSGVITPDFLLNWRGEKAKWRVGLEEMEGRNWEGKTDEGE
jgi:hypothetical protein